MDDKAIRKPKHRLFDAKRRDGWHMRMGQNGKFYSVWNGTMRFYGGTITGASFYPVWPS